MTDTLAAIVAELRLIDLSDEITKLFPYGNPRTLADRIEAISRSGAGGGDWISVKDRMPITPESFTAPFTSVVVLVTDGQCVREHYCEAGNVPSFWCAFSKYNWVEVGEITHWQPLPAPPQAGEGTGEKK